MNLKNGTLIVSILFFGAVHAQEKESVSPPSGVKMCMPQEEIIDFPDVEAEFPGGAMDLKKFIQENFKYPKKAVEQGDQGRVYVTFVVETDGSITGVDVLRGGLTEELNMEAIRLVSLMPPWYPAEKKGVKVRARCRLPITFYLSGPGKKK
jgi:protein TonB